MFVNRLCMLHPLLLRIKFLIWYVCVWKDAGEVAVISPRDLELSFHLFMAPGFYDISLKWEPENPGFTDPVSANLSVSQSCSCLVYRGWSPLLCLPPRELIRIKWESIYNCLENSHEELHKLKTAVWQCQEGRSLTCPCPAHVLLLASCFPYSSLLSLPLFYPLPPAGVYDLG